MIPPRLQDDNRAYAVTLHQLISYVTRYPLVAAVQHDRERIPTMRSHLEMRSSSCEIESASRTTMIAVTQALKTTLYFAQYGAENVASTERSAADDAT